MSVKVSAAIIVEAMDGTSLIQVTRIDTVVNPNPRDPTADAALARASLETMVAEAQRDADARLEEYGQVLARIYGGG